MKRSSGRKDARLLTVREVAFVMGVEPVTVRRMIERGDLRAVWLGRQFRVREFDLETFKANLAEVDGQ